MIGIVNFGGYLPRYRLTGNLIAAAWGGKPRGSRAVANYDEDALTLAVAGIRNCLYGSDPAPLRGLYLASTSLPYDEGISAELAAYAARLNEGVYTAEFAGSIRASFNALKTACDAIAAQPSSSVLVAAGDMRISFPQSPEELSLGDAGAALVLGSGKDVLAEIIGISFAARPFLDTWKLKGDAYLKTGDGKFLHEAGYGPLAAQAASGLLEGRGLKRSDITYTIINAPDMRAHKTIARAIGAGESAEETAHLFNLVGWGGTAHPLLGLAHILEQASEGEYILAVTTGAGASAMLLRTTEALTEYQKNQTRLTIRKQCASGLELDSYQRYLAFRGLVSREKISPYSAPPILWREVNANLRRQTGKCRNCGQIQWPPARVCVSCGIKDEFEPVLLGDGGTIYTLARDHLVPSEDAPAVMASVELDGGGRFYGQVTDARGKELAIGSRVTFCFRKLHEGGGYINYFWKLIPEMKS